MSSRLPPLHCVSPMSQGWGEGGVQTRARKPSQDAGALELWMPDAGCQCHGFLEKRLLVSLALTPAQTIRPGQLQSGRAARASWGWKEQSFSYLN